MKKFERDFEKIIKGEEAKVFERAEVGSKESLPENKRLSESEALLYQEYAAKKEGAAFSEKASEESYEEAEKLLEKLKSKEFDFLQINWERLDLSNAVQREDIQERLQAVVYELAKSSGNNEILKEFEEKSGKGSKTLMAFLVSSLIALSSLSPAFAAEKNVYKTKEESKTTEYIDYIKGFSGKIFSPHFEFDKEGKFKLDNLYKIALEPIALAMSEKMPEGQKIEISIPYKYSRMFDTGKPINQDDYKKLNAYIEKELLNELKENILAFSWDEEALRNKYPEMFNVDKMKITHISVLGSASPEAHSAKSEKPGTIERENIQLAKLRAENSIKNVKEVLNKLGIKYDSNEINIDQIETQFSQPEMEALEQIANKHNKDTFELIKSFNRGEIKDKTDIEALESIVASKRKVVAMFETEEGAPKAIVIPLPLLLGLLPFIRIRRPNINIPVPRLRTDWRNVNIPLPRPRIAWKDLEIERYKRKEFESNDLEIKKVEVLYDILKNYNFYEQIARRHVEDANLDDEHDSLSDIASDILATWEDIDNNNRQQQGIAEKVDYFNSDHQKLYAELHACAVRQLTIKMDKGEFLSQNPIELRKELEEIIEEEFNKYNKK